MRLRPVVLLLAVLLPGCPGKVTEIPSSDGAGGNPASTGSSGPATSGDPAPRAAASSSGGQASDGRPTSGDGAPVQGVTSAAGGVSTGSGVGGSGGDAGAPMIADGGEAGSPDGGGGTGGNTTGGTGTTGAPHGAVCWFERLGYGTRCYESANGSSNESTYDLQECAELCLEDESCTSIVDYTAYDGLPCRTYSAGCTPDRDGVWYEEDGGFEYVKVCGDTVPDQAVTFWPQGVDVTPGDDCYYMALDDGLACENAVSVQNAERTANTFEECLAVCDTLPECTAVHESWSGPPCTLHLSTCDQEVTDNTGDRFFKKICN